MMQNYRCIQYKHVSRYSCRNCTCLCVSIVCVWLLAFRDFSTPVSGWGLIPPTFLRTPRQIGVGNPSPPWGSSLGQMPSRGSTRRILNKIVLMSIGTSAAWSAEIILHTMNHILRSERCRLLSQHVDMLMNISIEGRRNADVRDGSEAEETELNLITDEAVNECKKVAHREQRVKCWHINDHVVQLLLILSSIEYSSLKFIA